MVTKCQHSCSGATGSEWPWRSLHSALPVGEAGVGCCRVRSPHRVRAAWVEAGAKALLGCKSLRQELLLGEAQGVTVL